MSRAIGELIDTGHGIRFKRGVSDRIPVIDFSPMWSSRPEERRTVAAELRRACCEVGFFYLRNHGIPGPVIRRAHAAMQTFFALPKSEKMKIHYLSTPNHRGYVSEGDIKADHEVLTAIDRYRAEGLDGVECYYVAHDERQTLLLAERCTARSTR